MLGADPAPRLRQVILTPTLPLTLALALALTVALTLALTLTRQLWMRALGWEVVICCDGLPAVRCNAT